jgi:hypothetical protein
MNTDYQGIARRVVIALLLAAGLGGCVYAPPYAAYDPYYYPTYGYPAYVGPPVTLDFGYYRHHHHHHHHGHGYYGGHGRHGWGYGGRRH